jgi:hypothetical protein
MALYQVRFDRQALFLMKNIETSYEISVFSGGNGGYFETVGTKVTITTPGTFSLVYQVLLDSKACPLEANCSTTSLVTYCPIQPVCQNGATKNKVQPNVIVRPHRSQDCGCDCINHWTGATCGCMYFYHCPFRVPL